MQTVPNYDLNQKIFVDKLYSREIFGQLVPSFTKERCVHYFSRSREKLNISIYIVFILGSEL